MSVHMETSSYLVGMTASYAVYGPYLIVIVDGDNWQFSLANIPILRQADPACVCVLHTSER